MAALLLASPRERLTGSLPPTVLLDVRKVLRRLRREADALLVVLETKGQILDYVGDERASVRGTSSSSRRPRPGWSGWATGTRPRARWRA